MRIILILCVLLLLSACGEENQQESSGGFPARVMTPEKREVVEWDEYTGRFQAAQRVELRSWVSGYVDEIKFDDGQVVQSGDVLFIIDPKPFEIALSSAKATYEQARREYERAEGLLESNTIAEGDFDKRRQEMEVSKAAYDEAVLNYSRTEVKAPFAGRVSRNFVDVGTLVSGGNANATLLTTIVSTNPIEFYFEVSESDVLKYIRLPSSSGDDGSKSRQWPVSVKLQDEKDFIHEGEVNFIDNEIDLNTGTKEIRAVFDNTEGLLEPGLFGRVRMATTGPFEALVIPDHVIGTEQTRKYAYTLTEDGKSQRSYLELGRLTEDGMRIVKNGLEESDRVIIGNLQNIWPGMQIEPVTGDQQQSGEEQ